MRRFVTGGSERYVWDPAVHARHGEDCYYYLLRAADPSSHVTLTKELNSLLRREGIRSHSIYTVFGYFDALIRLWATESSRRRFFRALNAAKIHQALLEFTAEEVRYDFAVRNDTATPSSVKSFDRHARIVSEAEAADRWDQDEQAEEAFKALLEANLIHKVPTVEGIKIYLVLSRTQSRVGIHLRDEQDRLIAAMKAEGFANITLYAGSGRLGDYLVKGVINKEFSDLWDVLTPIYEVASKIELRSMTLPIANLSSVIEADTIDNISHRALPDSDEIHAELSELFHLDGDQESELRRSLEDLTRLQLDALVAFYRAIADKYRGSPLFRRLMGILRGSLANDPDAISSELAFVTSIERDLRRILAPMFKGAIGEDWFTIAEDRRVAIAKSPDSEVDLEPAQVAPKQQFSQYSLFELFEVARSLTEESREISDALVGALDPHWQGKTRKVVELRNDFAHGRLMERRHFNDFDATWGAELDRILVAAHFAQGLRELRGLP